MAFIIFGDSFTFPEGNAATNRVHTYAKGFTENGIAVHVICFGNDYSDNPDGVSDGIHFYHPFRQKKRSRYFIARRWHKFAKYFKAIRLIRAINMYDRVIAINSWTLLLRNDFFAFLLARIVRAKLISEHSEHPLRNYQGSFLRKAQGKIKLYLGLILYDGIFCISQYLIDFYSDHGKSLKRLFLVPSTVDTERFRSASDSPLKFRYILYCGALTLMKDGVDILIKSFGRISEKYPSINLVLIGKADSPDTDRYLKDLSARIKLEERIFFLGQVSREDVPAFMTNAMILALARPSSIVADAGFPSKLTEYLATGVPVVVTEVGEIPVYLKNGENAFLSVPDSADAFAERIQFVLDNYEAAKKVAARGKKLTETIFNYKYQSRRMIDFISSL